MAREMAKPESQNSGYLDTLRLGRLERAGGFDEISKVHKRREASVLPNTVHMDAITHIQVAIVVGTIL